jgi:large subunit ribosomal protein L24
MKTNKSFCKNIKKGDTVKVISGTDKGKIGEVMKIAKSSNQVLVKEINVKKKHTKPRQEGDVGKIIQFEAPINMSNVMLYNQEKKIASRVKYEITPEGKKIRILKKLVSIN